MYALNRQVPLHRGLPFLNRLEKRPVRLVFPIGQPPSSSFNHFMNQLGLAIARPRLDLPPHSRASRCQSSHRQRLA